MAGLEAWSGGHVNQREIPEISKGMIGRNGERVSRTREKKKRPESRLRAVVAPGRLPIVRLLHHLQAKPSEGSTPKAQFFSDLICIPSKTSPTEVSADKRVEE